MTTQEKEFNEQIDKIGACYEAIKDALNESLYGFASKNKVESALEAVQNLRDIACMTVKNIHQPIEN